MMMRRFFLTMFSLFCLFGGQAFANDKMTVLLDWFVNPDHGPLIIAQENGYFADVGLEVDIVAPADPSAPPKLVAAKIAKRLPWFDKRAVRIAEIVHSPKDREADRLLGFFQMQERFLVENEGWAPIFTLCAFASRTTVFMVLVSPACPPQAILHEDTRGRINSSLFRPSPTSTLISIFKGSIRKCLVEALY